MREIGIGVLASLFFAVTFILNRSMELSGGSWMWSASLRYFFMVPFLLVIVILRSGLKPLLVEMKSRPVSWFSWSFVGFVLFYAPLTYAAAYGPGWLISGTWQVTIIAGVLLTPLFLITIKTSDGIRIIRHQIPKVSLAISMMILVGIVLIQVPHANEVSTSTLLLGTLPVVVAAFAYPLGNRKMMEVCGGRLDTFSRVLGMTLATIPVWILLSLYAFWTVGLPSMMQVFQSFIVGVSSGVIATTLFFMATDRVRNHQGKLAAVEATLALQIIFVIIGEMMLLGLPLPEPLAFIGLAITVIGIFLHSFYTRTI
ncbi:DMT family transporter [Paenisporosarcina antarctica]|uniref:Multidrug resistance efflux transporter family protein n=1 Tax=Paenisporosarcina antarctica TaxID=417367 RepID=A0A4P7A0X2_9BACL|nr:multidrug resistance efflux transporter family protein [Paenisporosarcina antarctica]QBP42254.1 multidrug resistance efflux transporter family protein [Paenisporosarcina antarctica]